METVFTTSSPLLFRACSGLLGLVFLGTGILKSLRPRSFARLVREYGLLPERNYSRNAPLFFIAGECALGVLLLLDPGAWALSGAALLLVGFVFLTSWGSLTGRVEDCGCYGEFISLRPWQSVALDFAYLALAVTAWMVCPDGAGSSWYGWAAPLLAAAAIYRLAARNMQKPLETSPLKTDKAWRAGWLKDDPRDLEHGERLVVFLGRECPYCKRWVPLLNVVEVQPDLPGVLGVLALSAAELEEFKSEHMIHFPLARMQRTRFSLLAEAVPTAVLLRDGKIVEKWTGKMPESYMERIRGFFEAIAVAPAPSKVFGG